MRLTLRTMLAYLDEILEPDDAADIGKKIEESEFATDLVRRTRDVIRRLRLGAPPLVGKGIALDPNTVAEYLDNTLSSERVPDFEKICLESDVHLAEVAACHQVLTLVLGEPAEIEPASREQMYALARTVSQADQNVAAATVPPAPGPDVAAPPVQAPPVAASVAAPPVATTTVAKRQRPEVPDYLREKRSIFWPLAVALLILVSVAATVGGGLFFFGPPEVQNFIASLGSGDTPELPPTGPEQPGGDANSPLAPAPVPPLVDGGPRMPADGGPPTEPGQPEPLPPVVGPTEPGTTPPADGGPAAVKPLEFPKPGRVEPPVEGGPPAPLPSETPLPRLPGDPAAVGPAPVGPAPVGPPTAGPGTPPPSVVPPLPGQGSEIPPLDSPRVATLPKAPGTDPTVGPAPGPAPASEGLGRYLTGQDVLLRYDRNDGSWRRMPANANVFSGDFLLALPTYSPSVSLSNGVVVRPIGPVQFEMQKGDAGGVPGVIIDYGRVVFMTVGKGAQVRVTLGDQAGLLTFGDADSSAAVEVRRMLPFGQNPETGQTALAAEVYAASGQIGWTDASGETPLKAPASKIVASIPGVPTPAAGEIPKWIAGDTLSDIEKRGTRDLEMLITTDRPVTLTLKEQAESRRLEVRTLAIRCSAYVNQFDPFVSALNDAEQRGNWNSQIDTLRSALARGPEVAAAVRATLEKQRGEEGNELYRMLWGYSADQVPAEGFKLVRGLDHKSLDYRVLSFWNLQSLSGNSFAYKPADLPVKRAPAVLKWKERLEEGKLLAPVATPATSGKPPIAPPVAPQPGPVPAPQPQ